MHPRILLRSKFIELLKGQTDCGQNVFRNRARPFIQVEGWQSELPAIIVYSNSETSALYDEAPAVYRRTVNMVVEIYAAADEDTDDFLDHVAEQVEILVSRFDWHLIEIDFSLGGSTMQIVDTPAQQINGALAITFEMSYYSPLPDAGKADGLDDFLTAANTYRVGSADSQQTVKLR